MKDKLKKRIVEHLKEDIHEEKERMKKDVKEIKRLKPKKKKK